MTPYEIVIDRLDDREGGRARSEDRPLIAGVIYNRLARRHDSSGSTPRSCTTIRRPTASSRPRTSRPTPRTTRASGRGLPPTPIASPGRCVARGGAEPRRDRLLLLRAVRDDGRAPRVREDLRRASAATSMSASDERRGRAARDRGPRTVGVIGWPVAHSLSPAIHNAAFADAGDATGCTCRSPSPPGRVPAALDGLVALGFAGANVTMPHKTRGGRAARRAVRGRDAPRGR